MVKNHARKNAARTRQDETGETFPEAMRQVTTAAPENRRKRPVIHLGNKAFYDMNAETPNLNITGAFGTRKTTLALHILDQLRINGTGAKVVVITDAIDRYRPLVEDEGSKLPDVELVATSRKDDQSKVESMLEDLADKARTAGLEDFKESPFILMVDGINSISDEATIHLQMIAKRGAAQGIYTIITSQDGYGQLPIAIRNSGANVKLGWGGGFGTFTNGQVTSHFCIGAPVVATSEIQIGSEKVWGLDHGNLLINGKPGHGKTVLAQDIARQALSKGWAVSVLVSPDHDLAWHGEFGTSVNMLKSIQGEGHTGHIDSLLARRARMDELARGKKDFTPELVIIDGLLGYMEDRTPRGMETASALVTFLRNGNGSTHMPAVVVGNEVPWFRHYFNSVVAMNVYNSEPLEKIASELGISLPKDTSFNGTGGGFFANLHTPSVPAVRFDPCDWSDPLAREDDESLQRVS